VLALFTLTLFPQAMNLKWVLMGQEKMSTVARGLVLAQTIFAVAVLVFVHSPDRLVWVPILRLAADSAVSAYFLRLFTRSHGGLGFVLDLAWVRQALRPAVTMGISQAMGLLNYNFDSVLLGFLRGATVVGWYNAAYKPVIIALALPMTYFIGLYPALARSYGSDRDEFRGLVRRSVELSAVFVVPLVVGGMLLAEPIIHLLYGPEYASSAGPFRILVWSAALVILRSTYAEALRATGYQKLDLRCAITSASFNVALNVLLTPRYGMLGAASATVTADVIWLAMAYYYFQRDVLTNEPLPSFKTPVLAGVVMAGFLWLAQPLVWSGRALIAVLIYLAILIATGDSTLRAALRQFYGKPAP
jgi:O-antigen/teichoic acid export membrane protein